MATVVFFPEGAFGPTNNCVGIGDVLRTRGHRVETLGPWGHSSSYQLIAIHPETGAYLAGSDPRCDGHAAGF